MSVPDRFLLVTASPWRIARCPLVRYCTAHCTALLQLGAAPRLVNARASKGSKGGKSTPMTPADAARIQSAAAKAGGGGVAKGSFAARVQSAAARNANAGIVGKEGGK